MKIHEAIAKLDDSEISTQGLNQAITSISQGKDGISKVTFCTNAVAPGDLLRDEQPILIMLRIDRAAWKRVTSEQ